MRLLHPKALIICAERKDITKTIISHCWAECFKWKASGKPHPKMFIDNDFDFGIYLGVVYDLGMKKGCKFNRSVIKKQNLIIQNGFNTFVNCVSIDSFETMEIRMENYFRESYLFSDACSLYYKGINIFPNIFGDKWRKFVPVESLKEIKRQVDKTLSKKYIKIAKNYLKDFKCRKLTVSKSGLLDGHVCFNKKPCPIHDK